MGLLKSVLSLGGAAIGGAVGGPAGAKLGAALGGAAGGALSSSGGSKKATAAQLAAIAEARKIQGEAKGEAVGYQQPYMDFGKGNVNALASRLGVQQPQPTNALTGGPAGTSPLYAMGDPGPGRAGGAPQQPGVDPGTYGATGNPSYTPYGGFDPQRFEDSPILQAALQRGSDQIQTSAAARGYLKSGATMKDLYDHGVDTAYKFYDNERNFDYGRSRDDRSDYNYDRGYLTDRFDTQTNNLYRGVGVGQGAAGVASSAASRYGDQVAGLAQAGGDAKAQNYLTQGQIGSDLSTGLGGIIAGAFGGGGGSGFNFKGGNALTSPNFFSNAVFGY